MKQIIEKEIRRVDFSSLRQSYERVKEFIETETCGKVKSLNTKIEKDIRITGDDTYELMLKFVTQFNLNSLNFDYSKHFYYESEVLITDPWSALCWTLLAILTFVNWLISFLSRKSISFETQINGFIRRISPKHQLKERLDLTFGDMLTWYLEKQFKLREQIRYEFQAAN